MPNPPDTTWEPLVEWVGGLECDALLVAHGVVPPLAYVSRWNQPLRGDPAAYAAAVGRWLDYYEREGIAGIGIGAVVLSGRAGGGWVRGHRLDQTLVYEDEYSVAGVTMSLAEGVGLTADVDPEVLPVLFELSPATTVRAAALEAGSIRPPSRRRSATCLRRACSRMPLHKRGAKMERLRRWPRCWS